MIVLRALPLSLSLFWRLLVVLPVLCAALVLFGGVAFVASIFFAIFLPTVIVLIIALGIFLSFFTTPMLVGTRLGLTLFGHTPKKGYGSLWLAAIGYGLVVGLVTIALFLTAIIGASYAFGVPLDALSSLDFSASDAELASTVLAQWPRIFYAGLAAFALLMMFYAAILLPIAAASIGKDANGNSHTPFAGFGAGLIPLLILVLIAQAATYVTDRFIITIADLVGQTEALDLAFLELRLMSMGGMSLRFDWAIFAVLAAYTLIWLWTVSLQCAGAVLVYQNRHDRHAQDSAAATALDRLTPEDAHALWKDRMPSHQR